MPSSIPGARDKVYDLLLDRASTPDTTLGQVGTFGTPGYRQAVQITYGPPEAQTEQDEVVGILGVEDITTEHASIGTAARFEERYAIHVRIKVWNPLCTGAPVEVQGLDQRAWAIYEEIRATIAANQTLDAALGGDGWAIVSTAGDRDTTETPTVAQDSAGNHQGWVAFIPLRVACRARIS